MSPTQIIIIVVFFSLIISYYISLCDGHDSRVNNVLVSKETVVLCQWESETKIWVYQMS